MFSEIETAVRRWLAALSYRWFVWLAPCVLFGCALGAHWALKSGATSRDETFLWLPLLLGAGCSLGIWFFRSPLLKRVTFGTAVILSFTTYAARMVLPPAHDISQALRPTFRTDAPLQALPLTLTGRIVHGPQLGDYGQSFVLECDAVRDGQSTFQGRIWIEAPRDIRLNRGDVIKVLAPLIDLPRAGHGAERVRSWRYILHNCWCRARISQSGAIQVVGQYATLWERQIGAARRAIFDRYESALRAYKVLYPHATSQLLTAMVFGEGGLNEPLPPLVRDHFRAAGLTHVLVASGSQVALFALLLIGGFRLLGQRSGWILMLVLPVLIGYALLTGGAASIWRATLAGTCLAAAWLWGRENDPLNLWSMALAILLLIDPRQLFDLGFQLTFAATWGLIVLAPALQKLYQRVLKRSNLWDVMAFSLGAQLATWPVVAYHFGQFSIAGFGANAVGVPLAGILVTTGMLGLLWAPATLLSYWLTRGVAAVATFAAHLPGAQWESQPWPLAWTVLCYLAFALAASTLLFSHLDWSEIREAARHETSRWWQQRQHTWRNWHPGRGILIFGVLVALFCVVRIWQSRTTPLRFTVLDVGQGEALLLQTPSGRTLLIDAGTTSPERGAVGRSVVVPYLQAAGVRRLDVMAVTHADADHCNALIDVMKEVPVGVLLDGAAGVPGQSTLEADYMAVRRQAQEQQIPVQAAQAGQTFDWGDGVRVQVLAPLLPPLQGDNDNALVLRVEYGNVSFLLTADIEGKAEERLVRRGSKLRCTVLKVAHHGSRTSSSQAFLRRAQPQIALISCGRYNSFGHPAPQTLGHLQRSGAAIYRTDLNGTVEVACDTQSCWVQPFR